MSPATLIIILLALSSLAYYVGRRRAIAVGGDKIQHKQLHSRPTYYGALTAIWCGIPALLIFWILAGIRVQSHHPTGGFRSS